MGMVGTLVDAQIAKLAPAQRAARQHALDRLFHHPLGETPLKNEFRGALLDAADEAGVMVIHLLLQLAAGEHHLLGIDHDDVVAAVHMGSVGRACACRAAASR